MRTESADWIEHRRGMDGERLGWMAPAGEDYIVIDLLGRPRTEPGDWLTAEEVLDDLGIGYLADPYELRLESGEWLRVRITEVSTEGIRVKKDDWGDMTSGAAQLFYSVAFPPGDELRTLDR
jgi:hypothetical protein